MKKSIFFYLLFICPLFVLAQDDDDAGQVIYLGTGTVLSGFGYSYYTPSVFYERSLTGSQSLFVGSHLTLGSGSGMRLQLAVRGYTNENTWSSFYVSPGISAGVHMMDIRYQAPSQEDVQWVDPYEPSTFVFLPFAFASILIEDNEIYDQQLRYMAGVQLAVGCRKALGARQRWIADAQIQAGYYAPLNDPEPTVTYMDQVLTLSPNGTSNPSSWSKSFLGKPLRGQVLVGYRF